MTTTGNAEQAVLEQLREELAEAGLGEGFELTMESSWGDIDVDSIDVIEIASAMEDRLEIEIDDTLLRTIKGVGDMVRAIVALQAQQAEPAA
ncbi:MAG TPA: phosphopantetheine-binding protein [Conexibacter sp.]|nr:phosphopantetheine-binding protein [Conexibacter sp.]